MTTSIPVNNVDPTEVAKFDAIAHQWWDQNGDLRTLHQINPIRVKYIANKCSLDQATVLDIGCGGGILSEALALEGANVTAIDMAEDAISIAKLHAYESGLEINYQCNSAEQFAEQNDSQYDVVTCLEMLEHVPDPASVVKAASKLVKPGGHVFFSTINRNTKAWLLAIVAAEKMLKLLPDGTHDKNKFIKPAELASMCRDSALSLKDLSGIQYNPISQQFTLNKDLDVNYICCAVRDHA